jgi:hypothetical protein
VTARRYVRRWSGVGQAPHADVFGLLARDQPLEPELVRNYRRVLKSSSQPVAEADHGQAAFGDVPL